MSLAMYLVRLYARLRTKPRSSGAYVCEISKQPWALIGALADAGVRVKVPINGLPSQRTYREAYSLATELPADERMGAH